MNSVLTWTLSSLFIVVSLSLLLPRMASSWEKRDIFGAPASFKQQTVWIGISLVSGIISFTLFGLTAGIASVMLASVFIISAFTDYLSAKAPKDLAYAGALIILTVILVDWVALRGGTDFTGLAYVGISFIIVISLLILLGLLFPGGFGMADARLFLLLALATYWFTPVYLLVAVIGASAVQLVLRSRLTSISTENNKKAYPYIPALAISSLISIPVTGLFLL